MDKDFQDFWAAYRPDEIRFPNRMQATYRQWCMRIPATRQAMLKHVQNNNVPKWKNPYFFVQEFPDPTPHNYNGQIFPDEPMVIAKYNGVGGVFTRREAELFGMTDIKDLDI